MESSSRAKHGVGERSPACASDENSTAAARQPLLRFSKRPRKPNSDPVGPVVASAARLNAMDDPCRRLALKELRVCEAHGGFGMLAMQGKFQPSGRSAAFRAATVEGRSPPAPLDLMRLPLYQEANERTRMRLVSGLADARLACAGAANAASQYLGLSLKPKVARVGRRPFGGGLRYRRVDSPSCFTRFCTLRNETVQVAPGVQ